jgi:RNA polymerase sigma factor (sigma-70 family)
MPLRRRVSYKHPLGEVDLPKALAPQELELLVVKLRAGDQTAKKPIIDSHYRLVLSIVGNYTIPQRHRLDDIVSVALLELVETVEAHAKLIDNNITPYIVSRVCHAINLYIDQDKVIRVPKTTRNRNGLTAPKITSLDAIASKERKEETRDKDYNKLAAPSYKALDKVWEHLESVLENDTERKIIELKLKGLNGAEIAKAVGLSESRVSTIKNEIQRRFFQFPES